MSDPTCNFCGTTLQSVTTEEYGPDVKVLVCSTCGIYLIPQEKAAQATEDLPELFYSGWYVGELLLRPGC